MEMELKEETYRKFGYYPSDLAPQSHKYVIVKCDSCGEIRDTQKRHEDSYCRKCSQTAQKPSKKTVLFIGDMHIGSSGTDVDEIKALAKKYWKGKPIVLMGDICDLGLDRGMGFDNKFGPQEQYDLAKEIFKPLNVKAYTIGNHENRIWAKVGIQPFKELFNMPPSNELTLSGRKIYFNHGISAAQDAFREHQRYIKWMNSDILCLGHNHLLGKLSYMRDGKITHLCRTGSFLRPVKYTITAGFDPKIRGYIKYDLQRNYVHLMAINDETGEVFEI